MPDSWSLHRRVAPSNRQDEALESTVSYELVRKAGPYEVLTHLFHDLGVQSNTLVSAQYMNEKSTLTPERIYTALREVINKHPALSTIGIKQPSEKKDGYRRLWEAHLPVINLRDCVTFVDALDGGDDGLSSVFETTHNQWFETQDHTKPWWRLIVYGGMLVVFVYHHSIGDGLSGYTFHRSLLAALNEHEASPASKRSTSTSKSIVQTSTKPPPAYPLDSLDDKLSWPHVIYGFLFWQILRFFINHRYFLFSDAKFPESYSTVGKPLPLSEQTITKAKILRLDRETTTKCVIACRKHNTSFTALLHTLIQTTLAADIYPKAELGFSRQAVNIRPLLNYRAAGSLSSKTRFSTPSNFPVNVPLIWDLAAAYKAGMNTAIHSTRLVVQDFLVGKLLGEDIEEIGGFYGMVLYQNNSFLISNLGVFQPREEMVDGGWGIREVGFSAGAIRASMGDIGPSFNVASVKGGDFVVVATWEEVVLAEEMVWRLLEGVKARMKAVIEEKVETLT